MSRSSRPSTLRRRDRRRSPQGAVWGGLLFVAFAVVVVIAAPALAAKTPTGDEGVTPRPRLSTAASEHPPVDPAAPAADQTDDAAAALALVAELRDVSGTAEAEYERSAFGEAWYDVDRNGCDTRNDILRRDLTDTTMKPDTNGCKVLTGTLVDPYSGEAVDFVSGLHTSSIVQIDHIIPLSWAWHHGAEHWTLEERREFANDPDNLLATIGSVNQSKRDSGPDEWLPPAEAVHCEYTSGFVELVAEWDLGVNSGERSFLEKTLASC